MSLRKHARDWEELADLDPFWSILSDQKQKFGKHNVDRFFLTGDREIEGVMESATRFGYPVYRESALDFGCGVGRLTRALAKFFDQCQGVDISERMVTLAEELNREVLNCSFVVNVEDNLRQFPSGSFDMIYTNIVLQHMPSKSVIKSYVAEFIRLLKSDGLLVFQLLANIPFKNRLQPRRRAYGILRSLGFNEKFAYNKLGLNPLRSNFISEHEVTTFLASEGGRVLEIQRSSPEGSTVKSNTYYVTKQPLANQVELQS